MPSELIPASFSILLSDGTLSLTTLTRTIHPVGQGALYSEIFSEQKKTFFTAVYDCGSNNKDSLTTEIKKTDKVDLIFISHFHDDHINGIKEIQQNVKPLIIIPGISHYAFVIDLISNYLYTGDIKCDSISFMLDCLPALRSARNSNNGPNQIIIGQDRNWESKTIVVQESLKSIGMPDPTDDSKDLFLWRYDAYFHKYDKVKEKELIDKLSEKIPQLAEPRSDNFKDEKWYRHLLDGLSKLDLGYIKKVFSSVYNGSPNRYSMLVHSYPVDKDLTNMDCLYTGDIPITESVKPTFINIKPHYIQVPHHGSKSNYIVCKEYKDGKDCKKCREQNECIYNHQQIAFISVGNTNSYGHPHKETLIKLIHKCRTVHVITENGDSKYKYSFKLK